MRLHKLRLEVCEQLAVSLCIQRGNIIKENGEITHAQLIHLLTFCKKLFQLRSIACTKINISTRGERIDKFDVVLMRCVDQVGHNLQLFTRIQNAPLHAVLEICFGRIYVGIHLVLPHKHKQILAVLVCPRIAVKALDHAAQCVARRILDPCYGKRAILFDHLYKRHKRIVHATLGLRLDRNSLTCHVKDIRLVSAVRKIPTQVAQRDRDRHAVIGYDKARAL